MPPSLAAALLGLSQLCHLITALKMPGTNLELPAGKASASTICFLSLKGALEFGCKG